MVRPKKHDLEKMSAGSGCIRSGSGPGDAFIVKIEPFGLLTQ